MEDHTVSTLYQSGSQQPQGTNGLSNNSDNTEMYEMLTMATHERSSEYQQLQICTGNQGLTKLTIEEYCNKTKNMKRILFIFILINTAMLVIITAIAITPLVFNHSQPMSNDSTQSGINILKNQLNLLAATIHRTYPRFYSSLMQPIPMQPYRITYLRHSSS